jgi:outer membrane immunogenic protein
MKKYLFTTLAVAALGAAPALAADLGARGPYYKGPAYEAAYAPIYNWTGFYFGGHLGGAFASNDNFDNGLSTGNNANGRFLGGLQVGADFQFAPTWVVGVEGQYSWLSGDVGAAFPNGFGYTNRQRGLGSITGRFGYTWGPGLIYVKGGYAHSDNNEAVTLAGASIPFVIDGDHRNGYTVGAGLEYMFAPNWSAKVEYQYYNFGDARFVAPALGTFSTSDHTVKAALNYRFNWAGPARY